MINTQFNFRCSEPLIQLVDSVCETYGFTRSELMRIALLSYCRELLATDALKAVCDMARQVDMSAAPADKLAQLQQLQALADELGKKYGLN